MDIFKLIFQHDIRMAGLSGTAPEQNRETTVADFMTPDPTCSRFYLTGTDLGGNRFGLNTLSGYEKIVQALQKGFSGLGVVRADQNDNLLSLDDAISSTPPGETVLLVRENEPVPRFSPFPVKSYLQTSEHHPGLKKALESEWIVLTKIETEDGFDLQIYSKENIYRRLFFPLQDLLPGTFRFFSINGKRIRPGQHFYFETWTLDRPPHGFEEVFPESVL